MGTYTRDVCLRALTLLPTYLSEEDHVAQAVVNRVSLWGHTTQRTFESLCGKTFCLRAGSVGSRCLSSPRPQHNSRFVDLQRQCEWKTCNLGLRATLLITAGLLTGEEEPTSHTHVGLGGKEGGIRISFPDSRGKKGLQRGHL